MGTTGRLGNRPNDQSRKDIRWKRGGEANKDEEQVPLASLSGVGTAVFYAEDYLKEEDQKRKSKRTAPGWNYGGAAARDAKNQVSKMVVGKESLPGAGTKRGQRLGAALGKETVQSQAKRRESHWDFAIRAAKAETATKYGMKEGAGIGAGVGANRANDYPASTSTAYGGWLSSVAGAEKDSRFREKILAERAIVRESLREQRGQALKGGLYSQGIGSPSEESPIPGRVVPGITSTSKKVKLKPSLSASTGGAAAAKTTYKVGAPVSRRRDSAAGALSVR